jgi:hypothetical protein
MWFHFCAFRVFGLISLCHLQHLQTHRMWGMTVCVNFLLQHACAVLSFRVSVADLFTLTHWSVCCCPLAPILCHVHAGDVSMCEGACEVFPATCCPHLHSPSYYDIHDSVIFFALPVHMLLCTSSSFTAGWGPLQNFPCWWDFVTHANCCGCSCRWPSCSVELLWCQKSKVFSHYSLLVTASGTKKSCCDGYVSLDFVFTVLYT